MTKGKHKKALFKLGQIVATRGALSVLFDAGVIPHAYLIRHQQGDWGDVNKEDKESNNQAVENEYRILSAYTLPTGIKIWIITEWDRSATTILLPEEY